MIDVRKQTILRMSVTCTGMIFLLSGNDMVPEQVFPMRKKEVPEYGE